MKGKLVTVGKSEINYVKKFSFRHILSSLHFNENIKRESRKTKQGDPYMKVSYPKFKLGEEVVREVAVPPTYGEFMDNYIACMHVRYLYNVCICTVTCTVYIQDMWMI